MKDVRIHVDARRLGGKLAVPEPSGSPPSGILFVHGWGGSQRRDAGKSKKLVQLGYLCLTFNLFGHGRTHRHIETVTRADNFRDVLAAYDCLAGQAGADPERIGVVGTSYGGYLATLLTAERPVEWLALRAPALYMDADFDRPKRELNLDPELAAFRRRAVGADENRALAAAARFAGDVLVVESGADTVIPRRVIANYLRAFRPARSVSHRIIPGADHGLGQAGWREQYAEWLVEWFGARIGQPGPTPAFTT